jgi:hypothetical protein
MIWRGSYAHLLGATIVAAVSVPTRPTTARQQPSPRERPPTYEDYQPPRTTAEGGAVMLLSGVFAGAGLLALVLAGYSKLFDVRTFGQISNLLTLAVVLLLLAIYLLVWEITIRLIARTDD